MRRMSRRCSNVNMEVELGFTRELGFKEAQRCLNCDVETVFEDKLCIECDACVDICPMDCITFTPNAPEADLRQMLTAPAPNLTQDLYVSGLLKTRRVMVKDEDVCLHCGLCAERCPTGAWDMKKFYLETAQADAHMSQPIRTRHQRFRRQIRQRQRFGLGIANELFAKCILRMGVPVASRNIFPSNIQGLPTWYEVRVSGEGWLGRRGGVDLMVAMNPQTWDKDVAGIEPGGYLLYNSTKPMPASKFRDDITVLGVPLHGALQHHGGHDPARAPAAQERDLSGRAVGAAGLRAGCGRRADRQAVQGQGQAHRPQHEGDGAGPRLCVRASGGQMRS